MKIAFFDIEGTVLDGDLSRSFIQAGRDGKLFSRGAMLRAGGLLMLRRVVPASRRADIRWRALLTLVAGHRREEIVGAGRTGLPTVRPNFKSDALAKIKEHHDAGDTVVLISGGMDEAAKLIAAELGADRGEGTRCAIREGRYTGSIDGKMCTGENKAIRASEVAAELGVALADCTAYGDSAADIPMLSAVGHAVAVDPDPDLAAEAQKRGWEVMRTSSKRG